VITVTLSVLDFMDQRPIDRAAVAASLLVYPLIRPRLDPNDPEPEPEDPVPEPELGQTVRLNGSTDGTGRLELVFDVDVVFGEVADVRTPDGRRAEGVRASLGVAADFHGAVYERRTVRDGLRNGDAVALVVSIDLGMGVVGHTTPTSSTLWFSVPFEPDGLDLQCVVVTQPEVVGGGGIEIGAGAGAVGIGRSFPVTFDNATRTAVVAVDGLASGHHHTYALVMSRGIPQDAFPMVVGRFRTPSTVSARLKFAFGSCHLPAVSDADAPSVEALATINRWQSLVDDSDFEFLLLIGDQIYGDGLDRKWPDLTPFERYMRRYRQLWAYWPPRDVLRSHPTYMMLDDHDVADDFGTGNLSDDIVGPALELYRRFQQALNPGGPGPPGGPFHYSFRWGPAAFFVSDLRTQRGEGTPVFGRRQLADLEAWAASEEVASADIIFFISPVPLALLPTETIRAIAESLVEQAGATAGAVVGFLLGATVGAPLLGAVVLGAVGHEVGEEIFEQHLESSLLLGADLAERWDLAENQSDLVRLLDLLFGLANGDGGSRGPKAVFVLSGDIHAGTMHAIRSLPRPGGADHRRNPVVLQLTSSALSHEPVNSSLYALAVEHASEDLDIDLKDLNLLALLQTRDWDSISADVILNSDEVFGPDAGEYFLDGGANPRYLTQFAGLLMERTVGRVGIELQSPATRRYRFSLAIRGREEALANEFDLELDANLVTPIRDGASDLNLEAPTSAISGRPIRVTATARNTGVSTWRPAGYSLAVVTPVWGVARVPLTASVLPGKRHTFRFTVQTGVNGVHPLQVQMTRRTDLSFFGPRSNVVQIRCEPAAGPPSCAELAAQVAEARARLTAALNQFHQIAEPNEDDIRVVTRARQEVEGLVALQRAAGCLG
jgi:hypothetical protein